MTIFEFTKEQIAEDAEEDGINGYSIRKASDGEPYSMNAIAYDYYKNQQQYEKAMAWYRLAAVENNAAAQNNIGYLYDHGYGVPQDHLRAIEWYLKSAIQGHIPAYVNISHSLEYGQGVPANQHKAFEWFHRSMVLPSDKSYLTKQRVQLSEEDKLKSIKQLIIETENIVWEAREKLTDKYHDDVHNLYIEKTMMEDELEAKDLKIQSLEEQVKAKDFKIQSLEQELQALEGVIN